MLFLTDRAGVAGRIHDILRNHRLSIEEAANRLHFPAPDVRAATEGNPTLSIIIAVVRHFGVDPMWVLTGVYKAWSHRAALEDPFTAVYEVLRRIDRPRTIAADDALGSVA